MDASNKEISRTLMHNLMIELHGDRMTPVGLER